MNNCHKNTDKLASIPENSTFILHKDFYLKPRITLLDTVLSPEAQQQLETLLEEFSDIMPKSSSDISLTHPEEMLLHKKPGSIPVASKPYSFPLKHHKFVKRENIHLVRGRTNKTVFKSLHCTNHGSATQGKLVNRDEEVSYCLLRTKQAIT